MSNEIDEELVEDIEDVEEEPEYVAKKSMAALTGKIIFGILFFWLLFIPLIKMIKAILEYKMYEVDFYKDRIVKKTGVFTTHEKEQARTKVVSVSIQKSFWGNICGYGDVKINIMGKEDMVLSDIKNPEELKKYMKSSFMKAKDVKQIVHD